LIGGLIRKIHRKADCPGALADQSLDIIVKLTFIIGHIANWLANKRGLAFPANQETIFIYLKLALTI